MNKKQILIKANELNGKKFSDISNRTEDITNKGQMGNIIESDFFGIPQNSSTKKDFNYFGVDMELKLTPIIKNKGSLNINNIRAKERLVLAMIDYENIITNNPTFESSQIYQKINDMLVIVYEDVPGKTLKKNCNIIFSYNFTIKDSLTNEEYIQFKADFNYIKNEIVQGRAHMLSEKDTKILGVCRKGAGGVKENKIFTSNNKNDSFFKRAFTIKQSFMSILHAREFDKICIHSENI